MVTRHELHCARRRVKDTRAVYRVARRALLDGKAVLGRSELAMVGVLRCRARYYEALRRFELLMRQPVETWR